jgi:hypothetical protein
MSKLLCLIAALCAATVACQAIPTGLNIIPTANVLGMGDTRVDSESSNTGKLFAPIDSSINGTQFGLLLGFEAGIDRVSSKGTVYNAKWRFKGEGTITPALAAGVQNIRAGETPQYYLVASKSILLAQGHAGLMRDENGDTLTLLGVNGKVGPIELMADHAQGGNKDRTGLGASFSFSNITVKGTLYDFENAPTERTITISYTHSVL